MQLCAFKLLNTLGGLSGLDMSLQSSIISKLLQAIDHDDARIRAEALRTLVKTPLSRHRMAQTISTSGAPIQNPSGPRSEPLQFIRRMLARLLR